jgi:hypothetical protein
MRGNRITNSLRYKKKLLRDKKYLLDYFKEHPCIECGEIDDRKLLFHHKDPSIKKGNVSTFVGGSREKLLNEIDKCLILCYNCHAAIHNESLANAISGLELLIEEGQGNVDLSQLVYSTKWDRHPLNPLATDPINLKDEVDKIKKSASNRPPTTRCYKCNIWTKDSKFPKYCKKCIL